jgi:hypothetical protein
VLSQLLHSISTVIFTVVCSLLVRGNLLSSLTHA